MNIPNKQSINQAGLIALILTAVILTINYFRKPQ